MTKNNAIPDDLRCELWGRGLSWSAGQCLSLRSSEPSDVKSILRRLPVLQDVSSIYAELDPKTHMIVFGVRVGARATGKPACASSRSASRMSHVCWLFCFPFQLLQIRKNGNLYVRMCAGALAQLREGCAIHCHRLRVIRAAEGAHGGPAPNILIVAALRSGLKRVLAHKRKTLKGIFQTQGFCGLGVHA